MWFQIDNPLAGNDHARKGAFESKALAKSYRDNLGASNERPERKHHKALMPRPKPLTFC